MPPVITPRVRQTQQFSSKFTRAAICPQAPGEGGGACWKRTNSIKSPRGITRRTRAPPPTPPVYSASRCVASRGHVCMRLRVCVASCPLCARGILTTYWQDVDYPARGRMRPVRMSGWESPRRGVMRQSDGEAAAERRACVRPEDGDNKLSPSTDTNTPLSGWDYLAAPLQTAGARRLSLPSTRCLCKGATAKCSQDRPLPEQEGKIKRE